MKVILSLILLVAVGYIGVTAYQSIHAEHVFNNWVADCRKSGGVVKESFLISSSSSWDDCYVNGKAIVVPGYESYQKDKPY